MRASHYFLPTLKENPAGAELISHQLMIRAGLIRPLSSGLYTWLPAGFRVLQKIERVVREEMDKTGAMALLMPAVQPATLWQETGRWTQFGPQLLTMQDRNQRAYCFGPTHEEVMTDLMRHTLSSYRQLPMTFYQIQTKFRDEVRPRFGVMRAREFMMKDAYSFHVDASCLASTYAVMYEAYHRIFTRLGLNYRAVLADTGSMGGCVSHEFQVLAKSGEDTIVFSDQGPYAANIETAQAAVVPSEKVPGPAMSTAVVVDLDPKNTVTVHVVQGDKTPWVGLVLRGDHTLNVCKAEKLPGVSSPLVHAQPEDIKGLLGCLPACVGPVNLDIPLLADHAALQLVDFMCGGNQPEQYHQHVHWGRDVPVPEAADIRQVVVGDLSPDGLGHLQMEKGIEVGHVFQLGDKYTQAMRLSVADRSGKPLMPQMGCYGIGVSRLVAAMIEQHHDARGIVWSKPDMAPFFVVILPHQFQASDSVRTTALDLYGQLLSAGIEVLLDDRDGRLGAKYADADLLGIPHRLVINEGDLSGGQVTYKNRSDTQASQLLAVSEVLAYLLAQRNCSG